MLPFFKSVRRLCRDALQRTPPHFDPGEYLRLNPDIATAVAAGSISPRSHWRENGRREGRHWSIPDLAPLPLDFNPEVYRRCNPDIASMLDALRISPAQHWVLHGRREGRRKWALTPRFMLPPDFDEERYLEQNPDVAAKVAARTYESGASFWLATRSDPHDEYRVALNGPELTVGDVLRQGFDPDTYAIRNPDVWKETGDSAEHLASHWLTRGFLEHRIPCGLNPYARRRVGDAVRSRAKAITCYGFFKGRSGLASAARNYRAGLRCAGFDVMSVEVEDVGGRFVTTPDVRMGAESLRDAHRNKVNIFFLNADMMHRFFMDGRLHLLDDSFNIGVWFWELEQFPEDWAGTFGALDEIWVGSEFCRRAIQAASPVPVTLMPQLIQVDRRDAQLERDHFGLSKDCFVFGCIFDIGSLIERKNPLAAIKAFKTAFGHREDRLLLLKYHGGHHYPLEAGRLEMEAQGYPNIRLIAREFDAIENVSFKAALDCLVSPHRSEGFGLNLAEAMLLETPVIATDYGGSTDFVDINSGYPIRYAIRHVGEQTGPYPASALWADPDGDDLVALMRRVVDDPARPLRARRGRERVAELYGVERVAAVLRAHFSEDGLPRGVSVSQGRFVRAG